MGNSMPRLLVLTSQHIMPDGKRHQVHFEAFYQTLAKQFTLVDVRQVRLTGTLRYISFARTFRFNRLRWKKTQTLNPWSFQQRSEVAAQIIEDYAGSFDLIFLLYPLFSPGIPRQHPYVVYTDHLYIQSLKYSPDWAAQQSEYEHQQFVALQRDVMAQANMNFLFSQYVYQACIEDYKLSPQKLAVVGAGGNLPVPPLTKTDYSEPVALFVTYDFWEKGGKTLLKAWQEVSQRLPKAQLWIIGPELPLAETPDSVRWLGRIDDPHSLMEQFQQASVFVMPAGFEAWSAVVLEAMGLGLPVIAKASGGIPDYVHHGQNGLLLKSNDSMELAEAMVTLLDQPAMAHALGHQAYRDIATSYTWGAVVERMKPHLQRAAGLVSADN